MNINCQRCHRSYSIAEEKIADRAALRCICGERLSIRPQADQGEKIGNYVLLQRIAVGGMGEIYLAKEFGAEGFEKEAAIKKMLPHLSQDRSFIEMMVKEAKLTNQLKHPNIVGIYNFAKEGDEYYMAMEYVPGITVGSLLEQCRRRGEMLPYEVVVHITIQILRGLAYAHNFIDSQGQRSAVLHRDITPQNILITQSGFVKITDFGIAKAVNEISTTSPGMIKGKMGYIAPEQLIGLEPDQRLDLFCAAILMWEMLMVQRLFKGGSEAETFHIISQCIIPPLSEKRNDVPAAIEQVMLHGLAKNRDERFLRAEDFVAEMSRAMFPRTPDEYAEVAASYFQNHDSLFDAVHDILHKEIQPATRALIAAADGSEILDSITNFGQEVSNNATGLLQLPDSRLNNPTPSQVNLAYQPTGVVDPGVRGLYVVMLGLLGVIILSIVGFGAFLWQREMGKSTAGGPAVATSIGVPTQTSLGSEKASKTGTTGKSAVKEGGAKESKGATEQGAGSSKSAGNGDKASKQKVASKANTATKGGSSLEQMLKSQTGKIQRSVQKCASGQEDAIKTKTVAAKMVVDAEGVLEDVRIAPSTGNKEVDTCLEQAMRELKYPNTGDYLNFQLSITVDSGDDTAP